MPALSAVAALVAAAPPASGLRAYHAELEAGYALLSADSSLLHGGALGGRFYAAARELVFVGATARYAAGGGAGVAQTAGVGASAMFRLDVLKWVPFFSVDVGWLARSLPRDEGVRHDLEVAFGLGADYLLSRDLAVGGFARYHLPATSTDRFPGMMTLGLRVVWRWE